MKSTLLALDVYQVESFDSMRKEISALKERQQDLKQEALRIRKKLLRLKASAILPRLAAELRQAFLSLFALMLCGKPVKRAFSLRP